MDQRIYASEAMPTVDPESTPPVAWAKREPWSNLTGSLRSGVFLPVIGSECSTIARQSTVSWREMSWKMQNVLSQMGDHDSGRYYLQSLMTAKSASKQPLQPSYDDGDLLLSLRKQLVFLAAKATEIFARRMTLGAAVNDAAAFSVDVTDKLERSILSERMVKACLAALKQFRALERKQTSSNARFRGRRAAQNEKDEKELSRVSVEYQHRHIYDRLLDFTYKFMGDSSLDENAEPFSTLVASGETPDDVGEVCANLKNRSEQQGSQHKLFLYQMEWLANLVFHSFSFDGTFYPTDDELSFRASLLISETDRRPASATVFTVFEKSGDSLVETISTWFNWYQTQDTGRSKHMKALYNVLACVLDNQTRQLCDNTKTDTDKRLIEPIAFSLNLDLEMEKALQDLGVLSYYVAIPVRVTVSVENGKQYQQRWLLGQFECEDKQDKKYKEPVWTWLRTRFGIEEPIDKPIVVKLHGSPLHEIPKSPDQLQSLGDTTVTDIDHLITLSETAYLHNLVVFRSLPEFFDYVFRGQRDFYFLGLSTSEWHIHLQMSDLVFPGPIPRSYDYEPERRMVAINTEFDDYRSSILDSLGIVRWHGPLEKLASDMKNLVI